MTDRPPREGASSPLVAPLLPTSQTFLAEAIATLSHELRTPLTAIKGFTTTLIHHNHHLHQAERMEYLEALNAASDRMAQVINRLEHMTELAQGHVALHPEALSLTDLVRDVVLQAGHVSTLVPMSITVEAENETQPRVLGDAQRLREVVEHLLENAMNYSPQGGQITIWLGATTLNAHPGVELRVRDEGMGISKEHQERIFDPFYRVDMGLTREVGGLGLGLAYCRRVVELLGGILEVTSTLGQGSTFILRLPAMVEA